MGYGRNSGKRTLSTRSDLSSTVSLGKELLSVDDASFAAEVEACTVPVLVDFWAPWCPPCKKMLPVMDELAAEMSDTVKVVKINLDQAGDLSKKFEVKRIPTFLLFKDGKEIGRFSGMQSKNELKRRIDKALKK